MAKTEMENQKVIGMVAYAQSKMMFVAKATTGNEKSKVSTRGCASTSKIHRWAFLVVSYEESVSIRKETNNDEEKILKKLQDRYAPKLKNAITNAGVKRVEDIRDFSVVDDKKLITSQKALYAIAHSLKTVLEVFDMKAEAKTLKEEHTKEGALQTRMLLPLDVNECNSYLTKEAKLTVKNTNPRARSGAKHHHAYAVVAWAYGYKKDEEGNLSLLLAEEAQVAFVPKTRFECGVFFDGTNNNMFNTELREEYEKFLKIKKRNIVNGTYLPGSWEHGMFIEHWPKSKVLPLIYKDLALNIKAYTQVEKGDDYENSWWWFFRNKASYDSEAIYDYFHNEDTTEVEKFVADALLPDGADSSYMGANTNIVKLHKLYKTDTRDIKHKEHLYECHRNKVYVTGAGTYDSRNKEEHQDDATFLGSAFAVGDTGVITKVNQACKDVATKLASLPVDYIDTLVLDVFGFSRGAAEARHFVSSITSIELNVTTKDCVDRQGKAYKEFILSKDGKNLYPYLIKEQESKKDAIVIDKIIFRFVGLFDTVPHYGLYQDDDAQELKLDLQPTRISRVVHITAKNEFRRNFSLYSIKSAKDATLADNFIEKGLFGAHSDIGGGYLDNHEELVKLAVRVKYSKYDDQDAAIFALLKRWNRRYFWVKNPIITIVQTKEEMQGRDGFYIIKNVMKNERHDDKIFLYNIYMYRKKIDSEYSEVSLDYMHYNASKIAPYEKSIIELAYREMLPFVNAAVTKEEKLHWAVEEMDAKAFHPYKSNFIHHSINVDGAKAIASAGNEGTQEGFYGSRKIYYVK